MEVLGKSDYQDIYRIKDGVLLVVNKFKYTIDKNGWRVLVYSDAKRKSYCKGCQNSLKVLTQDYYNSSNELIIKKGTVLYYNYVVELVPEEEWDYQIKTTGDLFSGTSVEVLKHIEEIINIIKKV